MAHREVPLEQNWKHWKEKYEIATRRHNEDRETWLRDQEILLNHAIVLGRALDAIMRVKP